MINCGFQGMNLSPVAEFQTPVQEADGTTRTITVNPGVTAINVVGDILNRSAFTSVQVPDKPDLSIFERAILPPGLSASTLESSFYYDPATGTLTYQNIPGVSLANVLQLLQNLTVQVYVNGQPQWLDQDQTIPKTTTI